MLFRYFSGGLQVKTRSETFYLLACVGIALTLSACGSSKDESCTPASTQIFTTADSQSNPQSNSQSTETEAPVSASRAPEQDWEDALDSQLVKSRANSGEGEIGPLLAISGSARAISQPYRPDIDVSALPEWKGSEADLYKAFRLARDERYYTHSSDPEFVRRAPWLYPIDGCYVRAAHVARSLERAGIVRPGKLFTFGRLRLQSPYVVGKFAYWSYHVAAAYRQGSNARVFDPSVDSSKILSLDEWAKKITKNTAAIKISVCDTYAYMPGHRCVGGSDRQERSAQNHLKYYLPKEWNNVRRLGLPPERVLGEVPPWDLAQPSLEITPTSAPSETTLAVCQ